MSIRCMTKVWDSGKHEGSKLLLLLAIADHANDDGMCYPGNELLAKKCRVSERHVKRMIGELMDSDDIKWVSGGSGGRGDKRVLQLSPLYVERGTPKAKKGDTQGIPSYRTIINHKGSLRDENQPTAEGLKEIRLRERRDRELAEERRLAENAAA